jgi:SHS family lactate transporter-like MFS transporter
LSLACFLGWTLDAFYFFILVFCVSALAAQFHMKPSEILEANFLPLAMRPVGAFYLGRDVLCGAAEVLRNNGRPMVRL